MKKAAYLFGLIILAGFVISARSIQSDGGGGKSPLYNKVDALFRQVADENDHLKQLELRVEKLAVEEKAKREEFAKENTAYLRYLNDLEKKKDQIKDTAVQRLALESIRKWQASHEIKQKERLSAIEEVSEKTDYFKDQLVALKIIVANKEWDREQTRPNKEVSLEREAMYQQLIDDLNKEIRNQTKSTP